MCEWHYVRRTEHTTDTKTQTVPTDTPETPGAPTAPDTLPDTVHEFVTHWTFVTRPARIEVIDASDDARLIGEALAAGELRPGFRENLGVLLWLLAFREGSVSGTQTSVGVVPTAGELDITGLGIPDADLAALISIDPPTPSSTRVKSGCQLACITIWLLRRIAAVLIYGRTGTSTSMGVESVHLRTTSHPTVRIGPSRRRILLHTRRTDTVFTGRAFAKSSGRAEHYASTT